MQTPELTPTELLRRIENLLREGTIAAVLHDPYRVRVAIGDITTDWLSVFERRAGTTRTWSPPSVGEQCMVLSPGGDLSKGWALVGINSDDIPPPSDSPAEHVIQFADGGSVVYNDEANTLTVSAPGAVVINAEAATINAAAAAINANTTITGTLHVTGNASFAGTMTNNGTNVGGTHTHSGVEPGPGNSGGPQ